MCGGCQIGSSGSNTWIAYDGISNHKKLLDSNANFEEFEVWTADKTQHIKAQTLRLYNPVAHQWSIYLVNLDAGTLESRRPAFSESSRRKAGASSR